MKILINFAALLCILFLSACSKPNEAVAYAEELSNGVTACTSMEEFDSIYNKIVALQSDPRFIAQPDLTNDERVEIGEATQKVITEALVVQQILGAMPNDIKLTADDMKQLVDKFIAKDLNTVAAPQTEVRKLINEHFNISE